MTSDASDTALPVEDVQDYPRPPDVQPVSRMLRILHQDAVIAETTRGWRVIETHHAPTYYLPPDDVDMTVLTRSRRTSFCEWKGRAAYYNLGQCENAAWCYPSPTDRFLPIKGMIAFYAWAVDACFVGEEKVIPQPGDFYGGWVTRNLTGTVKGGPGTLGW